MFKARLLLDIGHHFVNCLAVELLAQDIRGVGPLALQVAFGQVDAEKQLAIMRSPRPKFIKILRKFQFRLLRDLVPGPRGEGFARRLLLHRLHRLANQVFHRRAHVRPRLARRPAYHSLGRLVPVNLVPQSLCHEPSRQHGPARVNQHGGNVDSLRCTVAHYLSLADGHAQSCLNAFQRCGLGGVVPGDVAVVHPQGVAQEAHRDESPVILHERGNIHFHAGGLAVNDVIGHPDLEYHGLDQLLVFVHVNLLVGGIRPATHCNNSKQGHQRHQPLEFASHVKYLLLKSVLSPSCYLGNIFYCPGHFLPAEAKYVRLRGNYLPWACPLNLTIPQTGYIIKLKLSPLRYVGILTEGRRYRLTLSGLSLGPLEPLQRFQGFSATCAGQSCGR
ncbi:hypothetical protein PTH_0169 [Pelotomaculum thermopropionicum SI]|uniref:Uncharacterized protein n=1 Tax=Pelotomaculum thermopropionicum (strain DSM 13744 / JCM 10971 / SI) TaxID=370438 RepID=A5D5Y4_PELTS|nr:hypothetical protein PTH_0169 [Pelotomaculum thermopropionicum SI]